MEPSPVPLSLCWSVLAARTPQLRWVQPRYLQWSQRLANQHTSAWFGFHHFYPEDSTEACAALPTSWQGKTLPSSFCWLRHSLSVFLSWCNSPKKTLFCWASWNLLKGRFTASTSGELSLGELNWMCGEHIKTIGRDQLSPFSPRWTLSVACCFMPLHPVSLVAEWRVWWMELQPCGLAFSCPYLCGFTPLSSSDSTASFRPQVRSRTKESSWYKQLLSWYKRLILAVKSVLMVKLIAVWWVKQIVLAKAFSVCVYAWDFDNKNSTKCHR